MVFFQEYALLIAVALPVATVVGIQIVLLATGEHGTFLLPPMPFGTIDYSAHPSAPAYRLWTHFRDYAFCAGSDAIQVAAHGTAQEVAEHVDRNPGHHVAIDGANARRVQSVFAALKSAGVPSLRIRIGRFGDPERREGRRVAVLVGA